jgi:O-antigen ligase
VNELLRLYSGAAFFFCAGAVLESQDRFKGFARSLLLILLIPVCVSFLQVAGVLSFSYWDWVEGQEVGRASGMYQTPLELVRFLVFGVPLALWMRDRSVAASGDRLLGTTFLLLSLPALFFTFHRAGWIVIGLEIVLWFATTRKIQKTIVFVACLMIFGSVFSNRVQTLYSPVTRIFQGEIDPGSEEFLRGRGALWAIFLNSLFSSHPVVWFTGKGGSIAEAVVPRLADGISNEPHNDFIRILHAYGIVGIILYLAFFGDFCRSPQASAIHGWNF